MTEQEFKRRLVDLLFHPPVSTYASINGGNVETTDYYKFEEVIIALFKEAGYVQVDEDQSVDLTELNTTASTVPIHYRTCEIMIKKGWRKIIL